MIISSIVSRQLCFEIFQRIERMTGIEVFIILAMRPFYFTIMARRIGSNLLVGNPIDLKLFFEQCQISFFRLTKFFSKFESIICLYFMDFEREEVYQLV